MILFDTISSAISWVLKVTPRWFQLVTFLCIIGIIGNFIFPIFLNFGGVFCAGDTKYTGKAYDVFNNVNTYFDNKELRAASENNLSGVAMVESDCIVSYNVSGTIKSYYDGVKCTNCTAIGPLSSEFQFTATGSNFGYCEGDAYPNDNLSWTCESVYDRSWFAWNCVPPDGYYYSFVNGSYICYEEECEGKTEAEYFGATILTNRGYSPDPDFTPKAYGLGCSARSQPTIKLMGVDVFDYRLWLFLFLMSFLWFGYTKFR